MRSRALTRRALGVVGLLVVAMPSAGAAPKPAGPVPALEIVGRGFGHGVGMAQDGALAMGKAGATTPQILGQFYPGTKLGRAGGNVRVPVLVAGSSATLTFPNGGEIRDSADGESGPGYPLRVPVGGSVVVSYANGRYQSALAGDSTATPTGASSTTTAPTTSTTAVAGPDGTPLPIDGSTTTTRPPATTTSSTPSVSPTTTASAASAPPPTTTSTAPAPVGTARPLWAIPAGGGSVGVPARSRQYRGVIEAAAGAAGLRLVNQVNVETYLKGMGEVRNPSWPAASLRTQAIAARTYAMRAMAAGGELCDSQRCQVYIGSTAEYAAMNKAVNDTSGQVLFFGKGLASTVYSANGGGFSASREEGFGTTGSNYPYLRPSPYTTTDAAGWKVVAPLRDIAARLGYPGTLTAVDVARRGPSGRALEIRLDGSVGARSVTGLAFDAGLGLRSTLFTLRVTTAVPEGALGKGTQIQALPEDAAAVAGTAVPGATASAAALPVLPDGPVASAINPTAGPPNVGDALMFVALVLVIFTAAAIPGVRDRL